MEEQQKEQLIKDYNNWALQAFASKNRDVIFRAELCKQLFAIELTLRDVEKNLRR